MRKFRYIRKSSILFYASLICVVLYALTEDMGISIGGIQGFRRFIIVFATICRIPRIPMYLNKFKSNKYIPIICTGIMMFVALIYSANVSTMGYYSKYVTFYFIVFMIDLFLVIIDAVENNRTDKVIKVTFWIILILTVINDLMILMNIKYSDGTFETYFIGTKFSVSYIHIYLLAFYLFMKSNKLRFRWRYVVSLIFFSAVIISLALRVDCNTGIIGSLLFAVIIILFNIYSDNILRFFAKPIVFLAFLISSAFIAFAFETLINAPIIEHIIVDIMGRTTNLTGRLDIYALYAVKMSGYWLWGYGYGSSYTMSMDLFGYADAQNGILQWVLQIGIIPLIFLLVIWTLSFSGLSKQRNIKNIIPLITLIYVFILLGTVEITYNMSFIMWIGYVFMWCQQHKLEEQTE